MEQRSGVKLPCSVFLVPEVPVFKKPAPSKIHPEQKPVDDSKISVEQCLIPAECIKLEPEDEEEEVIPDEYVTARILGVEKKIKKQLDKERSLMKNSRSVTEEEVRSARYNRLMHLFEASTFYSTFMKEKLNNMNIAKTKRAYKKIKRVANAESVSVAAPNPGRPKKPKHSDAYNVAEVFNELKLEAEGPKPVGGNDASRDDKENLADDAESYVNALGLTVPRRQPPLLEGGVLRDYQLDGLEWLRILDASSVSGILADEMGLGKTIQVIALICHLIGQGIGGPFVIIAPLSTVPNWMAEFKRFAPQIPTILLHGTEATRRRLVRDFRKLRTVSGLPIHPVVVTSFQIPLVEKAFFRSNVWRYLVVDEGHRIKNHHTQLAVELKRLNSVTRLILTGTPLQNNLTELWSLLNFLLPEIFTDLSSFETWFDCKELLTSGGEDKILAQEQEQRILSTMHQILSPFLLRRLKADVELCLPPKRERLVFCPLTPTQKHLYSAVLDRSIDAMATKQREPAPVEAGGRPKRRCVERRSGKSYAEAIVVDSDSDDEFAPRSSDDANNLTVADLRDPGHRWRVPMQQPLAALRHIVNHPYLVQMPVERDGRSGRARVRIDEDLVRQSGKMLVLDALLVRLKRRGHKVLIFSSFTMMLDLLADFMELRDYDYCQLDGRVSLAVRQEQIRRFNSEPETFVFLISTRAGGLGINLTAADTVITYDSDWNPQADVQAQDRCHRIGQTKPVLVFRFTTEGTVDQMIIERATAKRKLEKMIIQKGNVDTKFNKMESIDLVALRTLLRSDDFESVVHSNGYVFDDNELEALLDRSSMLKKKDKTKPNIEVEE